jgi:hypothetical protein
MRRSKKQFYSVTHPSCPPYTISKATPQAAVRAAIKHWIANKFLTRQPATLDDGEFANVEVEILL